MAASMAVLERHLNLYRRLWRASVFSAFVMPLLFLLSIGMGVGGYVGEVEGTDYLEWIVPGILATTAFQMAIMESTYSVLGDFKWVRGYHAMVATPVQPLDIVTGNLLYILFRVTLAVIVFLAVTSLFGAVNSPWAVTAPLVCALTAVASAAPVQAFSATIEQDAYFTIIFRFLTIPATLFSGIFFPVEQMPGWAQPIAYAGPLWHAVELNRAATLGDSTAWPIPVHVGYLLLWAGLGMLLAIRAFRRRLQD